jgi:SMC interacting uncharacterized protein involved in chromosome segregation
MDMKVYVQGKSKNDLLNELGGSDPTSPVFELQKAGIIVRCTEDLEKRMSALGQVVSTSGVNLTKTVADLSNTIASASSSLRDQMHELDGTIRAELVQSVSAAGANLAKGVSELIETINSASLLLRGQVHELDGTVRDANQQNEKLQRKLLFLNVILTIATVVAAVATALEAWKAFHVN